MQNIHVSRYENQDHWQGAIQPEDKSWIVFVDADGVPSLWVETEITKSDGRTDRAFANVAKSGQPPSPRDACHPS